MGAYTVVSPIKHDGERYDVNDEVELKKDQAKPLVDAGVIREGGAEKPELTVDQVATAIDQLDPENEDSWTKAGVPTTEALAGVLGGAVSAALRDEAWTLYNAD